jgi:hypothetical protein
VKSAYPCMELSGISQSGALRELSFSISASRVKLLPTEGSNFDLPSDGFALAAFGIASDLLTPPSHHDRILQFLQAGTKGYFPSAPGFPVPRFPIWVRFVCPSQPVRTQAELTSPGRAEKWSEGCFLSLLSESTRGYRLGNYEGECHWFRKTTEI